MGKDDEPTISVAPSVIMRTRRPELYSDSEQVVAYRLSKPVFNYHLATLTERNEHKAFEEFCRALAQREICPNLRPQTGPEGGGDGKVDSENYPVAEEIRDRWFVGEPNGGSERWAVAVSAKSKWSAKVRDDVQKIVETNRGYTKVHFFTNQNPRAADRLRIEDELSKKHGIQVVIYDRRWIEDKTIDNNHHDLAYDILSVGEYDPEVLVKGPQDVYRERELDELERGLSGKTPLTSMDSVQAALRAAKLSRGLELPRTQTEGRFHRAIRLARKYGSHTQQLLAAYEFPWTLIWWFDDLDGASELYEQVEQLALESHSSADLEKPGNILSVFAARIRMSPERSDLFKFSERSSRLVEKLKIVSSDLTMPNNALYAETLLATHRLVELSVLGEPDRFSEVWEEFGRIIDRAEGLGEFPAELVDKLVSTLSEFAPDSEQLDILVLKLAEFMGRREYDGKQGEIFAKRGEQKLELEKPGEAIVWLGKAAIAFSKREFQERQVEVLYQLAVAYKKVGLYWAARAACLSCWVCLVIIGEEEGGIRTECIPVAKLYSAVCNRLGLVFDSAEAVYLLLLYRDHTSLPDEKVERVDEDVEKIDRLMAILIMGLPADDLERLIGAPDTLESLGLYVARMVILFRLGYEKELREDGSIPQEETDEGVATLFGTIKSLQLGSDLPRRLLLSDGLTSHISTKIVGVIVQVEFDPDLPRLLFAELLVSGLEAFAATMITKGAYPLVQKATVSIVSAGEPFSVLTDQKSLCITVVCPVDVDAKSNENRAQIQRAMLETFAALMEMVTTLRDTEEFLENLFENENVVARSMLFSNVAISRNRVFGSSHGELENIPSMERKSYKPRGEILTVLPAKSEVGGDHEFGSDLPRASRDEVRHSDMSVETIINPHLWGQARWSGTVYGYINDEYPPIFGLSFNDEQAGKEIFKELKERFGVVDEGDYIRIGIIKGIDRSEPHHYRVHISVNRSAVVEGVKPGRFVSTVSRMNVMKPSSDANLETFIKNFRRIGAFYFAPTETSEGLLGPVMQLSVILRSFHVTDAWQIGPEHEDATAVSVEDDVIIPDGVIDAPVTELLKMKRERDGA